VHDVLFSIGDISPDMLIIIRTMDDDMPRRGISFIDENGDRHYFVINQNQAEPEERSGMFIIIEFDSNI